MCSLAPSTGSPASASRDGVACARSACRSRTAGKTRFGGESMVSLRRAGLGLLAAACLAGPLAGPLAQARAQTVDGVEQAWRAWMAKYGESSGGLVVLHAGQPVREAAVGRSVVGAPVPLASLSKAVTAVCIAGPIERGRLSFDTPLSQALAGTLVR